MSIRYLTKSLLGWGKDLHPSEWGLDVDDDGHLLVDGVNVNDIAEQYDTPVHVISRDRLIRNCTLVAEAFAGHGVDCGIHYSYKTNSVPQVLRIIHEQGFGAEVISDYELWLALRLGVHPSKIIYNGPDKSDESLELSVRNQIKAVHIDSLTELERLLQVCRRLQSAVDVGIRIKPSKGWVAQFGLDVKSGEPGEALRILACNRDILGLKGIHVHLGSQITSVGLFASAAREIAAFARSATAALGIPLEYVDLGGGFGVPTVREIPGVERVLCSLVRRPLAAPQARRVPSAREFSEAIMSSHKDAFRGVGLSPPPVIIEPGRLITSNAEFLLLRVRAVKPSREGGVAVLILDGGRMTITAPTFYEYHEVLVANKCNQDKDTLYSLYGRTCTPSDIVYRYKRLPEIRTGDLIAIMDAGAYFSSFSTGFAFSRPAMVLVENGKVTSVRMREPFEERIALDRM